MGGGWDRGRGQNGGTTIGVVQRQRLAWVRAHLHWVLGIGRVGRRPTWVVARYCSNGSGPSQ
jgi:hypothetical protein